MPGRRAIPPLVLLVALAAGSAGAGAEDEPASAAAGREAGLAAGRAVKPLPRGGGSVLPDYRPVAFYGAPQSKELGALGQGSPSRASRRLRHQARPYRRLSKVKRIYPTFELIAVIALAGPGGDGKYRARQPGRVVRRYLREAREDELLMVLDIQPGRSTFIKEVRHFKRYLRRRNVGFALDPEWNMGPHGVPGERVGHVGAGMINKVSRFMNRFAQRRNLPDKLLVIHQFTEGMVRNEGRIKHRRRVDIVLNADGFGTRSQKRAKYRQLAPRGGFLFPGFKLFYEEDTNLMRARQVMRLKPRPPAYVVYE